MAPVSPQTHRYSDSSAVAIISSAGGIPVLLDVLPLLPARFPMPIIVAQHLPAAAPSVLAPALSYRSKLRVKWAETGELPVGGIVYVCPPGHQLEITATGFALSGLAPVSRAWLTMPDVLLRSLVRCYGARAIGIVLSGMMQVGVDGLRAIRAAGGIVMAQSTRSSLFCEMPIGAIDLGKAELILSPAHIAEALMVIAGREQQVA